MKLNNWINKKIDSFDQWAEQHGIFAMLIVCFLSAMFWMFVVLVMP